MSGTKLISKTAKCELSVELRDFYKQNVTASSENCFDICKSTVAQSSSPKWFLERKLRITASKGHFIANGRRTETRIKYFLTKLKDNENLLYGREQEPFAKNKFQELTQAKLVNVGLVVKPNQPWLSATPDALFKDENDNICVLEIKCPSSCKDSIICVPYIERGTELKKSHNYYTQCQIQMYVTGTRQCHFFVYSSCDFQKIVVLFDEEFL